MGASYPGRGSRAILGAIVIVLAIGWFDHVVLEEARRLGAATFRTTELFLPLEAVGYLLIAGGILAIAGLGLWARGPVVGAAYGVMGVALVFIEPIAWWLVAGRDGEPPILPDAIGRALAELARLADGAIGAVGLLGAGLLLSGLIVLAVTRRPTTHGSATHDPAISPPAGPTEARA